MIFTTQNEFCIWATFYERVNKHRKSLTLMTWSWCKVGLPSLYQVCINVKEAGFFFFCFNVCFCNTSPWISFPSLSFVHLIFRYAPDAADPVHHFPKLYIICYILEVGNGKKSTRSSFARTGYSSLIIDLSDVKWILHLISPGEEKQKEFPVS